MGTVRNRRSWLRKVALREFIEASSTNERRLEGHDQLSLSIPSDPSDIESLLEQDAVLSAIRQLPPLQRQVFALHFDQLSTREIAGTLQITEAAVRQNLVGARARLKELLGLSNPFDKSAQDVPATPSLFGPGAGSGPGGPPPRGPAPGGPQKGGSGPVGPGGGGPRDGGFGPGSLGPHGPARRRYLKGQCPESIPVGKPFSLVVSIILAAGPSSAELERFDVPPEGRDVLLVLHAPGLRLLSDQRQPVHVPERGIPSR